MSGVRTELYRYTLPLALPVELRGQVITERHGLLIRVCDGDAVGVGEVAPLPGFSRETFDQSLAQARRLAARINTGDAIDLGDAAHSVRFGFTTALDMLEAARRGQNLAQHYNPNARDTVSVNGLILSRGEDAETEAVRLADRGYRAVKLKVGRQVCAADAETVHAVADAIGPDVALRLDANRAWSLEEAVRFIGHIPDVLVEYIEEPLRDPRDLPQLTAKTGLPYALDESLAEPLRDDILMGARAWVWKPTLTYPLNVPSEEAADAKRPDIVLSAAYESGVGIGALANLAAAHNTFDAPAGLDTYSRFAADTLVESIPMTGGTVELAVANRLMHNWDEKRLVECAHE